MFLIFLGDLYGAIGSPVRLSRTVVIGRRQELVQRILYVLTYFIRCSELLETSVNNNEELDEEVPGTLITTSLRRGEIEESEYVLVTVHKPNREETETDITAKPEEQLPTAHVVQVIKGEELSDGQICQEAGKSLVNPLTESLVKLEATSYMKSDPLLNARGKLERCDPVLEPSSLPIKIVRSPGTLLEKKPPNKATSFLLGEDEETSKVTFLIGESMSPESDTESQQCKVEIKKHRMSLLDKKKLQCCSELPKPLLLDQIENKKANPLVHKTKSLSCFSPGDHLSIDLFTEYFNESNPVETRTIDDVSNMLLPMTKMGPKKLQNIQKTEYNSADGCVQSKREQCQCSTNIFTTGCSTNCSVEQDKGISLNVSYQGEEEILKEVPLLNELEIPRNESSDSALGDSESEEAAQDNIKLEQDAQSFSEEPSEWQEELEVPFPG